MLFLDTPSEIRKVSKYEWFAFALVLVGVVLSFQALASGPNSDGLLHVYFLDIGQGDAQLIQAPNGNQVLIDGGPDATILQKLGEVMPFNDRSIDVIILSHPHADHVNGLIEVLKRYEVGTIIENYVPYETSEYTEWNTLKAEHEVIEASAGQVVDLGDGVALKILFPYQPGTRSTDLGQANQVKVKNPHDYVVVAKLSYGSESVLFTGDMETKVETKLIATGADLSSQFLKVGHHGSKTSTSEGLLEVVRPTVAFMSLAAKNRYGHPHPTILERLEKFGIKYYRTDMDGSSDLILDGQNYSIRSF